LATAPEQWANPTGTPFWFPESAIPTDPFIESPFLPPQSGVYIQHHRALEASGLEPVRTELDQETLRQLRSLGYVQ